VKAPDLNPAEKKMVDQRYISCKKIVYLFADSHQSKQ